MRLRHLVGCAFMTLATLLAACGDSAFGGGKLTAPAAEDPARKAAMIAARQKFFGAENVDAETGALSPDEVHMSWVSVATFAASLGGRVVLFDAYIHKEEATPNYVPATAQDLVDLAPEYVFIGHGHFDHAAHGGLIARETGAMVVGTEAHCAQALAQAGEEIRCLPLFASDEPFGAVTTQEIIPGICTISVLHEHSAAKPPDPSRDPTNAPVPIPNPSAVLLHPPGPTLVLAFTGDEGGDVLYQFRIGHFALTYHDTAGPMKEDAPMVFDTFRSLPRTDVENGAILGFNQPTNGLRDPAMYIDAINPKVFIPNHHDFVTEYGAGATMQAALVRELESYSARPEIRWIIDPVDYLKPNYLSFDVDDARWIDAGESPCPRD